MMTFCVNCGLQSDLLLVIRVQRSGCTEFVAFCKFLVQKEIDDFEDVKEFLKIRESESIESDEDDGVQARLWRSFDQGVPLKNLARKFS